MDPGGDGLHRPWIGLGSGQTPDVSVLSYNVLAERYCKPAYFPYAEERVKLFTYRFPRIRSELRHYRPDIATLQEVDRPDKFRRVFDETEYGCLYQRRDGNKQDGCMMLYCKRTLELLQSISLSFNDVARTRATPDEVMHWKRDNVAQIAAFRHLGTDRVLVVANTHLYWDPDLDDLKQAQARHLLRQVYLFATQFPPRTAVLVCGDFNSLPESAVVRMALRPVPNPWLAAATAAAAAAAARADAAGFPAVSAAVPIRRPRKPLRASFAEVLARSASPRAPVERSDAAQSVPGDASSGGSVSGSGSGSGSSGGEESGSSGSQRAAASRSPPPAAAAAAAPVETALQLLSAYSQYPDGAHPTSNFTADFAGCLDYVFYRADVLRAVALLAMPPDAALTRETALPNSVFPSDHLCLAVKFAFR